MAARRRDPGMHVYHYASYEVTAMKRLMGRYATREDEVDELLRAGVFVDLYRVVRQGVRVGAESYSIKKLEPLYMDARTTEITDAGASVVQYELWLDERDDGILEAIRAYNEDDCRSLVGLRGWLEGRRAELEAQVGPLPRLPTSDGVAPDAVAAATAATDRLAAALTAGIPVDPEQRTPEQAATALLAALLDFHRRDAKPGWWEYFARWDASDDELIDDASSIGGLVFEGDVGADRQVAAVPLHLPAPGDEAARRRPGGGPAHRPQRGRQAGQPAGGHHPRDRPGPRGAAPQARQGPRPAAHLPGPGRAAQRRRPARLADARRGVGGRARHRRRRSLPRRP